MDKQPILQVLRELRFSSSFSEEDMHKLAEISALTDFSAGTTIFVEGSDALDLYLLRSGRVELCMTVPARGCLPILTLEEGDLLGWSEVLGRGGMTATAVAVKDTQAITVPAGELKLLCEQDHDIGYEIMRRIAIALSQRLVATRLQVLDLFADSRPDVPHATIERPR